MAPNTNGRNRGEWEDEHLRRLSVPLPTRCVAAAKNKKTPDGRNIRCGRPPMHGQRVCEKHGGLAPNAIREGQERMALQKAVGALRSLGQKIEPWERVDPREALLDVVHQAFTMKNALQYLINDTTESDIEGIGKMISVESSIEGMGSILVPHAGGAKASVRIKMFNDALDRCARVSKLALDAGVEEAKVRLAEKQSEMIAEVIRNSVRMLPENLQLTVLQAAANELRFRSAKPAGPAQLAELTGTG